VVEAATKRGEGEPVALRISILGRLTLHVLYAPGRSELIFPGLLHLTTLDETFLTHLAKGRPDGQTPEVVRRWHKTDPYDLTARLSKRLMPARLKLKLRTQSGAYEVVNISDQLVELESDIADFRRLASSVLLRTEAESEASSLSTLIDQCRHAIGLIRFDASFTARELEKVLDAEDLILFKKLRHASATLSLKRAELVPSEPHFADAEEAVGTIPDSDLDFSDLKGRLADLRERLRRRTDSQRPTDVFLACPMFGSDDYRASQTLAHKVATVLRDSCGVGRVFFAAEDRASSDDFEEPATALQINMRPFRSARAFAMILPKPSPSGVLVEAGLALALGLPSVYFVPTRDTLPWILRDVSASAVEGFPTVRVVEYFEDQDLLLQKIRNCGRELFPPSLFERLG